MSIFESFIPGTFTTLSKEEKEIAITNLMKHLCKSLNIDSIPINFCELTNDKEQTIAGKFIYDPLCVVINKKFINDEEIEYLKNI